MNAKNNENRRWREPGRRTFLAGAAGAASGTLLNRPSRQAYAADSDHVQGIDFNRSYGHYFFLVNNKRIWVRVNLDCRLEIFDRTRDMSEEYLLSVRTQTGLRTQPLSNVRDPGYDFWFIFSKRYVYTRRELASSYGDRSDRRDIEKLDRCGWHLHRAPVTPLVSGEMIRDALQNWQPVVARTVFSSADGTRGFSIEYPVKWADGNPDGSYRVETGPVLLLDAERVQVGQSPEFDDFQWAYLDYRSLDGMKVFLEQPTPVLSGVLWKDSSVQKDRLTPEQVEQIENRMYEGWEPPIAVEDLKTVFMRNHYSTAEHRAATTELFAFD